MMRFNIRFSGGTQSEFGDYDFETVLLRSLERFQHRLKHVTLYIKDVNGPRGGIDKQCRCVLHLRRMPPVVIQDKDESVVSLVQRVANRASYVLSQKAARKTKRFKENRGQRKQPLALSAEQWDGDEANDRRLDDLIHPAAV